MLTRSLGQSVSSVSIVKGTFTRCITTKIVSSKFVRNHTKVQDAFDKVDAHNSFEKEIVERKKFQLRPYQEECVKECLEAVAGGTTRIGVSSPTGSGKTTIFTELLKRYVPPRSNAEPSSSSSIRPKKIMILTHTIQLVHQTYQHVKAACPDKRVEIEQGKNYVSGLEDITIASSKTLARKERLENFKREDYMLVIVDEAHHAVSTCYREILSHFDPRIATAKPEDILEELDRLDAHNAAATSHEISDKEISKDCRTKEDVEVEDAVPIIGFSATFSRHDGLALSAVFQRVVWHQSLLDMIRQGWLSPCLFKILDAKIDLSKVSINYITGDFVPTALSQAVDTDSMNEFIVRSYAEFAGGRRSTLVFGVTVPHVKRIVDEFRKGGVDARWIANETHHHERAKLIADFRAGVYPVLVNCAILTEGADLPEIDCVIMARPTKSKNLFSQMLGRGLRLSPKTKKTDCLVMDFARNAEKGVICAPDLFGLRADLVDGRSMDDPEIGYLYQMQADKPAKKPLDVVPEEFFKLGEYTTIFDLVEHTQGPVDEGFWTIQRLTTLNWVGCGNGKYVLELMGLGHIVVQRSDPKNDEAFSWHTSFVQNFSFALKQKYSAAALRRPKSLGYTETLEKAILGGNCFAAAHMRGKGRRHDFANLSRYAFWRRKAMITPAQQKLISLRLGSQENKTMIEGVWIGRSWKERVKIDSLSRGEANDIITRLKHGAKASWEKRKKSLEGETIKRKTKKRNQMDDPLWRKLVEEGKVKYTDLDPLHPDGDIEVDVRGVKLEDLCPDITALDA